MKLPDDPNSKAGKPAEPPQEEANDTETSNLGTHSDKDASHSSDVVLAASESAAHVSDVVLANSESAAHVSDVVLADSASTPPISDVILAESETGRAPSFRMPSPPRAAEADSAAAPTVE